MVNLEERLKRALADIEGRDQELAQELRDRRASEAMRMAGELVNEAALEPAGVGMQAAPQISSPRQSCSAPAEAGAGVVPERAGTGLHRRGERMAQPPGERAIADRHSRPGRRADRGAASSILRMDRHPGWCAKTSS
jgi:hypothetical protein